MKILLKPATGAPVVLAGEQMTELPGGIEVDGQRLAEIQECARAENARPEARGNRRRTITFKVTRKFDTEIEAEMFFLKHEGELPEGGTLEMRSGTEDGPQQSLWFLNAVVVSAKSRHVGSSVFHDYALVAGKLSTTQPS